MKPDGKGADRPERDRFARWRPGPRLPSVLPGGLRSLLSVVLALAAFMLANTLYLSLYRAAEALDWTFLVGARTSLSELFQAMVLTHTGVGLLLALLALGFFLAHLPAVWKRRHRSSVVTGALLVTAGLTLVVTGLFILTAAASRANRWAWWAHVLAAALLPLGYAAHRLVSYAGPSRGRTKRFAGAVTVLALALVGLQGITKREVRLAPEARQALEAGLDTGPGSRARDVSESAVGPFVPVGFVPSASPFFPSAATTTTGGRVPTRLLLGPGDRPSAEEVEREARRRGQAVEGRIGAGACARCHPDVTEQWAASAHRFASFNNPFYEATIDDMRRSARAPNERVREHADRFPGEVDGTGRIRSKWCAGCHDPALLFTGRMGLEVDRSTREAQAGLTCLACHAIDTVRDVTGNGNYNLADLQEDPYLFADAAPGSWGEFLHDAALKAKPAVHQRLMLRPLHRRPEFCAGCHKVALTPPVNDYRWLRGQNEYDAWHDSGVARNASRTFYLPDRARVCQDCHMPPEPAPLGDLAADRGTVRSHRFLAVNTALPHVRGDTATLRRIEKFLRAEKLRVEIFALRRGGGLVMDLHGVRPALTAGERVTVDVVVRNLGVGHTFPGGTNDSNEGWLELTLFDASGRILVASGAIGADGHLDPMAHAYKAVMLDRHGNRIQRRNAQDIRVTAAANLIGPGTADVAHYAFRVPEELEGRRLTLRARLLWRKFDRVYTEFVFEANPRGFAGFDAVPELPVTEIASDEVTLPVRARGERAVDGGAGRSPATRTAGGDEGNAGSGGEEAQVGSVGDPPMSGPETWVRYNDYGIGLHLEGNARLAAAAFRRVAELAPDRIDGPLNLARTALREGDIAAAYERLREVEAIRPGDARAAWVWGTVLQEDGRYGDAAAAYRRALEEFPDDRAAWRNLGRTLYLDGRYEEALEALDRTLGIDPEDRVAHYHRMLVLRALGREREAAVARAAFEYYAVDESARELTLDYLRANPGVNLMAQSIHTHELEP